MYRGTHTSYFRLHDNKEANIRPYSSTETMNKKAKKKQCITWYGAHGNAKEIYWPIESLSADNRVSKPSQK